MKALFINCTLKKSPETSHTRGLINESVEIFEKQGVSTEVIRAVDLDIDFGIQPKMSENDAWPNLYKKVLAAEILIICTPIWLGEKSSVCTKIMERLYSNSAELNDESQSIYYNRVGGTIITGNEDGGKHCAMSILYGLQHLGYTIPPQADAYWVGEAGPGKSYLDAGKDNDFTKRNTRIMSWNLMHFAKMLKDNPIPAQGNTREG